MAKTKKVFIETWTSDNGCKEFQHFLKNGTYVFGVNGKLISKKIRKKVFEIIQEDISKGKTV